jgi:hypothetical protein
MAIPYGGDPGGWAGLPLLTAKAVEAANNETITRHKATNESKLLNFILLSSWFDL